MSRCQVPGARCQETRAEDGIVRHLTPDTRHLIVAEARSWIGTPYEHQASLKGVGADCLGLVRGVWRGLYSEEPQAVPAYGAGWAECEGEEKLAEAARRHLAEIDVSEWGAGDLLLFRWRRHLPAKHAAIAATESRMVHAQEGAAVCEVPVGPWWRRHLAYAFRFPGAELRLAPWPLCGRPSSGSSGHLLPTETWGEGHLTRDT